MLFNLVKKLPPWWKLYYGGYFILSSVSYGFLFTFFPNILVDMKFILNTTTSRIALYTTAETVGYIFGTLVGLSYKYVNRQLVVGLIYVMLTIASALIPMVPNIWILYLCGFLFGLGSSAWVSALVVWTMELWGRNSRPFLQTNDFSFAVGSILCTLILKPYLVGDLSINAPSTNQTILINLNNTFQDQITNPNDIDRRSRLMWPVLNIGFCILPVPISSLIMFFIKPFKKPEKESKQVNEDLSPEKEVKLFDRPETPQKIMRLLFALWYTMYIIFETVFLKFAVTYFQYCPLKLPAQEAAHIFSIATVVYTTGRGLNVFIGLKVSIRTMLSYHYVILVVGTILLIVGQNILSVLWVSSIVLCWGFSAMFAGIYTFTGQQLTMTNQLNAFFLMIRGLFTLFTPVIIGEYLDNYSMIFIFVEIFYLLSSLILFVTINYMIRRYTRAEEKVQIS